MSDIQGMQWQTVGSQWLGQSCPCGLDGCSPHGHSLGQALLAAFSLPQQVFHVPGIFNFLGFPLQLLLYSHSFKHLLRAACRGSDPLTQCLASQEFLLNLGGSLCDSTTLAFCMSAQPAFMDDTKVCYQHELYQDPLEPWLQ